MGPEVAITVSWTVELRSNGNGDNNSLSGKFASKNHIDVKEPDS